MNQAIQTPTAQAVEVTVEWSYVSGETRTVTVTVPAPPVADDLALAEVLEAVMRDHGINPEWGQPFDVYGGLLDSMEIRIDSAPAEHVALVGQTLGRIWDEDETEG